ncbi:MAG: hypothetical protein MJZ67_00670 [Bacteroidales bacterium]|nr:hypothetical protein [Bacteroidales bacterium]
MRKSKTSKQAYVAPVVRSVAFQVERGFAGSPRPEALMVESVAESQQNFDGSHFSYGFRNN